MLWNKNYFVLFFFNIRHKICPLAKKFHLGQKSYLGPKLPKTHKILWGAQNIKSYAGLINYQMLS